MINFSNIALDQLNYNEVLKSSDETGKLSNAIDDLVKAFKVTSSQEKPTVGKEIKLTAEDKKDLALLEDVDLEEWMAVCANKNLITDSSNTDNYERKK